MPPQRNPINLPFVPDLNQLPCPTTIYDGTASPVAVDFELTPNGDVQLVFTAGGIVPLGERQTALASPIHLPGRGGGALQVTETDARAYAIARTVILLPRDFMEAQIKRLMAQLLARAVEQDEDGEAA